MREKFKNNFLRKKQREGGGGGGLRNNVLNVFRKNKKDK